ncbi:hypothetical protein [Polynucleobacter sp. HIN10]|jgi:hypothetical protein|uniref:hypothetical protein n=1 Tax=Polynucleobacter sp. HIN10 TaxID=3047869 RepID=UPI0025730A55|nr:hypothetical protein [Polynucleobacter sp. HIN10]BEI42181.1 hypothetical protein PHIN10_03300 [Polynucleobacter sp. HIN10]
MSEFIQTFFERKARQALNESMDRASDLSYFKQVKRRIEAGEDLSKELPQLKKLAKKDAVGSLNTLIKRCDTDLANYWNLAKAAKSKVTVKHEKFVTELVPRFKAAYEFKTAFGEVTVSVKTQGNYILVSADMKDVKKGHTEVALMDVEKQLSLAGLLN